MSMLQSPAAPPTDHQDSGSDSFRAVAADWLRLGSVLRAPIYDAKNVLLLARGETITELFLRKLKQRNIATVKVHESELARIAAGQPMGCAVKALPGRDGYHCPLENDATKRLDQEAHAGRMGLPEQGTPFAERLQQHGVCGYAPDRFESFVERQVKALDDMDGIYHSLADEEGLDGKRLANIVGESLTSLAQDADLFTCLNINPYSDRYPVRHSLHMTMLALSLGVQLQLDLSSLQELAIGCLIHDAGMLKIRPEIFDNSQVIDRVKFLEITKHPVIVFDLLKDQGNFNSRSAFVAYQVHERMDGSGYPRRRAGHQIHFLSRLAAVADAYVALVAPRPYRPGMLPYKAVELILRKTKLGQFDPQATRALLRAVSLFPIGSFLELKDGRVGRVVRTNGDTYHRPIIEAWLPNRCHGVPEVLDLAQEPGLEVVRPLPALPSAPASEDDWD